MKKQIIYFITSLFFACNTQNPYAVAKNKVGKLTNKNKIFQLKNIFEKDSVVSVLNEGFLGKDSAYEQEGNDTYFIYEKKTGKHLLTIIAAKPSDSLSNILCVEIFDERYITKKGIGLKTDFQKLNAKTYIRKIETSFNFITLFLDEIGATMTLSKKDLGLSILDLKPVLKQQIPALAKPKSFVLWFDQINEK